MILAYTPPPVSAVHIVKVEKAKVDAEVKEAQRIAQKAIEDARKAEEARLANERAEAEKARRRAESTPNAYPRFQCTWHAKLKRPDIPNHLGNADRWFYGLKSMGWAVGLIPKAGAIGQSKYGMHVVYIESVKGNQVYLSERNYDYNGGYRERWANASDFLYIY